MIRFHKANAAQVLTTGTGGTVLEFVRQKGLEGAIQKLGAELHTQYVLSFVQADTTSDYHKVEVRVAGREALHIRSKPGYWFSGNTDH